MLASNLDDVLCATLRGDLSAGLAKIDEQFGTLLLRRAEYHGMTALLNERLSEYPEWPTAAKDTVRRRVTIQAFWELEHQQILTAIIDAMSRKGIEPLLFKGTALAYGVYINPAWRTRGDTDLFVEVSCARIVAQMLTGQLLIGYERYQQRHPAPQKAAPQTVAGTSNHSVAAQ